MYRLTVRASKDSVAQTLSDLLHSQLWRRRVSLSQQSLASSRRRSGFFNVSNSYSQRSRHRAATVTDSRNSPRGKSGAWRCLQPVQLPRGGGGELSA